MLRRHFLSWERPLLPQAVEWLAGSWTGEGALDLGSTLVVVPTRNSGRRLREALAVHAANRSQAVFAPRVVTPEELLTPAPDVRVASRVLSLLCWVEVLRSVDPGTCRSVLPVDPPARNFSWALALAQQFERLRRTLAEGGLGPADVAARAGDRFAEKDRWREIADLCGRQLASLAEHGFVEENAARIESAATPLIPPGATRIVVIGTPDPLPLAVAALESLSGQLPVDVIVFGRPEDAASFDAWGRPLPSAWSARTLVLGDFERRVHLCTDPADEAALAGLAVRAAPAESLAIGVADPEAISPLEGEIRRAGREPFNPEGRPRRGDRIHQLARALSDFAREDAFAAVAALARCPDLLAFLASREDDAFSPAGFLQGLDDLQARHLPPDLDEARRQAPDRPGWAGLVALRKALAADDFAGGAAAAMALVFDGRILDPARREDAVLAGALEAWSGTVQAIGEAAALAGPLPAAAGWELALAHYGAESEFEERTPGAVDLQGWLELLWEDAPQLVVAGLNDGRVPEAVTGDAFLPESIRATLGLKTNPVRFARDAYILQALAACRAAAGRVDLLFARASAAGDPVRPSRLLLRCADADLPRRVEFLFREPAGGATNPGWRRAWKLQPRRAAPPGRVAVTGLGRWLECPFRFYLDRVLRLDAVDPGKSELDALEFGTLCHGALQAMGDEPAIRASTDRGAIREFLLARLDADVARQFGRVLTLPLVVQLESARQRLSQAAAVQAQARAEGWVIEAEEREFKIPVRGIVITGRIDRIDRNEKTGAVRVLDYKTSDRPDHPGRVALRPARREETAPAFARCDGAGREQVWANLQLPVYLRALAAAGIGQASCGYFNLPKASAETGIAIWEDYTPELDASAWRCVEGIVEAIERGQFWPPAEDVRAASDPYASLFHQGAAASIAWEGVGLGAMGPKHGARDPGLEASE